MFRPASASIAASVTDTAVREPAGVVGRTMPRLRVTHEAPRSPAPAGGSRPSGIPLRRLLVAFDVTSFVAGWSLAVWLPWAALGRAEGAGTRGPVLVMVAVGSGLAAMAAQRLYRARVCSVRAVEIARSGRAALASAAIVLILSESAGWELPMRRAAFGAAVSFLLVSTLRGVYSCMLRERRARGLHARPIVLVGTNDESRELAELVETHPEFGYLVVGIVGDEREYAMWSPSEQRRTIPYLGNYDAAATHVRRAGANGVLMVASAVDAERFNNLTRDFLADDLHVHLSSGLRGISARRLRSVPLAHEPLFYLEPVSLSRVNAAVKRAVDLAFASFLLLLTSPLMIAAAIAVKVGDRGPVIFKQTRVGRNGREFEVFKFRTMVPNAEQLLPAVAKARGNLRDSVLFKLENDPRRTRVGRVLEAASIDELPQLFNVLRGEMSMVGPRPALPAEVAQFDDELLERLSVPPGITGLWQVEARDNPSFSAYKRLDLFYVENWSVTMDLAVMVETATSVLGRLVRGRRSASALAPDRR